MLIHQEDKINIMMIAADKQDVYYSGSLEIFMTNIADRIKHILNREGLKQKQLADLISTSPQTVNNWIKRNSISREAAQQISERFGYSLDWLLTGKGDAKPEHDSSIPPETEWFGVDPWDDETPVDDGEVAVRFLKDIEFACGDGSVTDEDYNGYMLRFSKATLRRVGARTDGSGVLCFPARGDSMEPNIPNGTTVAVNTDDKRIIDGKIYAINENGWKRIKMLYRTAPDTLSIRSYNKADHPDEEKPAHDVEIIGRVFWWSVVDY